MTFDESSSSSDSTSTSKSDDLESHSVDYDIMKMDRNDPDFNEVYVSEDEDADPTYLDEDRIKVGEPNPKAVIN